jgi:hypothetical protein
VLPLPTLPPIDCARARRVLEQGDAAAAPERDAALDHLDRCDACSALGPRLDPLLLFRRLPEVQVSPAELERMRESVAVLRRAASDPEPLSAGFRGVRGPRLPGLVLRLAAAVLVAAAALWLAPGPLAERGAPSSVPAASLAGAVSVPEFVASVEMLGTSPAYVATQVSEDDLTLVILANVDVAGQ